LTYFGVLGVFVVPILLALAAANLLLDARGAAPRPWIVVAGLSLLALLYTTPWDNYLVASGVWSYDPRLVTGLVFGWVPVEEYAFFVLQTLLTGLWTALLLRLAGPPAPIALGARLRLAFSLAVLLAVIACAGLLATRPVPGVDPRLGSAAGGRATRLWRGYHSGARPGISAGYSGAHGLAMGYRRGSYGSRHLDH
jgi:lycopene cyclase domain-containing protein